MNVQFEYPHKTRNDFLQDLVGVLIKRRRELNITQEGLNHELGVADRLVSKWECGTRTPRAFHLYCWADALNGKLIFLPNERSHELGIPISFKEIANDNSTLKKMAVNDNKPLKKVSKMST